MKAWQDGRLVDDPTVSIEDRGLRGHGVFETLRCGHSVFRLEEHLQRARDGAAVLGIQVDEATLADAVAAVQGPDTLIRLMITAGPGELDESPIPHVTANSRAAPRLHEQPVDAALAGFVHSQDPTSAIKALGFTRFIAARRQVPPGSDALLRNEHGRIAEASTANVMALVGDQVLAPAAAEGALPGITRQFLLDELAMPVEQPLTLAALQHADEAWLCNTNGIRPLRSVQGAAVHQGPVVKTLQRAYAEALDD